MSDITINTSFGKVKYKDLNGDGSVYAPIISLDSASTISVTDSISTSVTSGRRTVSTAGQPVTLGASAEVKSIAITAETDNTGIIAIGGSGVIAALSTRQGIPLSAGDTVTFNNINISSLYIDTTVNGDGVTYTAVA